MATTVKKELTDKDLANEAAWIKKMAESAEIEEPEVIEKLQERFSEYAALNELKDKPTAFIVQKVKNRVTGDLKGAGTLDSFHGYLDAPTGEAKDWNAAEIKAIQDTATSGGPAKVQAMANADPPEIAFIIEIVDGKPIRRPVRKLLMPMRKGKDKKWYVVQEMIVNGVHKKAYELWEKPGDPIVPLDVHQYLKDGTTENFGWGAELKPNFGVTLVGTFFPRKEASEYCPRRSTIQCYGDLANPANKDFIIKTLRDKGLFGVPVLFKGVLDQNKSTGSHLVIGVRKRYTCQLLKDIPTGMSLATSVDAWTGNVDFTADPFEAFEKGVPGKVTPEGKAMLEEAYNLGMRAVYKKGTSERVDMKWKDAEKANEKAEKAGKPIPYTVRALPFTRITMENLREWHEKYQMTNDEFGVAMRRTADDSGEKQVKNYTRYALLECSATPADSSGEGQSVRMVLQDSMNPDVKMSVFLPRHITQLSFTGMADIKFLCQTRKKADYWDTAANARVEDGDGRFGEITVDIYSMMVTFVHPEDDGGDGDDDDEEEKKKPEDKSVEERPDV